jgi:transcriptional regulator with XRE-family HTH domain
MGKAMTATRRAVQERQLPRVRAKPLALRQFLGISQEKLAQLIGVSLRTVARWESANVSPSPDLRELMDFLLTLAKRLEQSIDRENITAWLTTPNPEFLNQPPIDLVRSEYGRRILEQQISRSEWGIPG